MARAASPRLRPGEPGGGGSLRGWSARAEAGAHRLRGGKDHRRRLPLRWRRLGWRHVVRSASSGARPARQRSWAGASWVGASASRAARSASMESDLAPARRAGFFRRVEFDDQLVGQVSGPGRRCTRRCPSWPPPQAGVLLGQGHESGVAVRIGGDRRASTAPVPASTTAAVCVWRRVSTPMTTSTSSASMGVRPLLTRVGRSRFRSGAKAIGGQAKASQTKSHARCHRLPAHH
jgi:hypothetical protein